MNVKYLIFFYFRHSWCRCRSKDALTITRIYGSQVMWNGTIYSTCKLIYRGRFSKY